MHVHVLFSPYVLISSSWCRQKEPAPHINLVCHRENSTAGEGADPSLQKQQHAHSACGTQQNHG